MATKIAEYEEAVHSEAGLSNSFGCGSQIAYSPRKVEHPPHTHTQTKRERERGGGDILRQITAVVFILQSNRVAESLSGTFENF